MESSGVRFDSADRARWAALAWSSGGGRFDSADKGPVDSSLAQWGAGWTRLQPPPLDGCLGA
eukprot:531618-Prymnesium_polylepis.1